MSFDDKAAIEEFVVASRERLAEIENQFLAIEATGDNIDNELVCQAFSAVRSIEGVAGFFGFATLQGLALKLENILALVRDGQLTPAGAVVGVFLRVADRLREMLADIEHSNGIDALQPAVALRAVATGRLPAQRSPVGEAGTAAHQPSAEIPSRQRHAAVVGNVASHAVTGAMDPVCGTRG